MASIDTFCEISKIYTYVCGISIIVSLKYVCGVSNKKKTKKIFDKWLKIIWMYYLI